MSARLVRSLFLLALAALPLIASCGKKAPPRLVTLEPPPAPVSLAATRSPGLVVLKWEYSGQPEVSGFVLIKAGPDDTEIEISAGNERHYVDTIVAPEDSYRYRVFAISVKGESGEDSEPLEVGPAVGFSAPGGASGTIGKDHVEISWDPLAGEVLYNVYRRAEGEPLPLFPLNGQPIAENVYRDAAFAGSTVHYEIRAVKPIGGVAYEGPGSDEVSISPEDYVASPPRGVEAAFTATAVVVFWEENPESWVRGYAVYRALGKGELVQLGITQTPAFTDTDASRVKHIYVIRALGPAVEGQPSAPLSISPPPR